jgi:hypothetical protein
MHKHSEFILVLRSKTDEKISLTERYYISKLEVNQHKGNGLNRRINNVQLFSITAKLLLC